MVGIKISDISPRKPRAVVIPPSLVGEKKKEPIRPKSGPVLKKGKSTPQPHPTASAVKKKTIWWPVSIILGLVIIAGVSYVLIEPKAEVSVWPKTASLEFNAQVMVSASQNQTAFISGEVRLQETTASQQFPATGVEMKTTKASGKITVYNAYSTSPQTLIATTRFVSDNGKLFRTPQKLVIPGAHYEGSKLIPGEIEITVEAGEPGEQYNIGPSTFSLPGLAGTPRYTAFYAKSFSPMTGGASAEVKKVTTQDIATAEEILRAQALENCRTSLLSAISLDDFVVVQDAIKAEVQEATSSVKAGANADNFTFQVKAKAQTIIFKRADISAFAKEYVLSHLAAGQELAENSLAVSFDPKEVDLANQKIFLDVAISAKTYKTVDENAIKEVVKNQSASQIISSLGMFPEIVKSQARLWPFWTNVAPSEAAGISVEIRLD
jgi:hypothetical protein